MAVPNGDEQKNIWISKVKTSPRAIVIGGGIAGILAARVLSDHFDQVILLERDQYPDGTELRPGVPQARHVHILLLRGKQILEQLFPGLGEQLLDKGSGVVQMGQELAVLSYFGWRVRHQGGLTLLTFTLPLLERCLRERLAEITQISIITRCRVTGLIAREEGRSLSGIRCRFSNDPDHEKNLYGDLIIDASGRFSRNPQWLSALGYTPPPETIVDPFLGYASRLYEPKQVTGKADTDRPAWKALLLLGKPPGHTRGGVLLPVEGNRWHITLAGVCKDYPPRDERGFLQFARSLRSGVLYDAIEDARPLSKISGYQATRNRRRRYETMSNWPENFIVLGDALCAFNPVYAQGISVAAMEVMILGRSLRQFHSSPGKMNGLARQVQRQMAKVIEIPWMMATLDDTRWPATKDGTAGLRRRFLHGYLNQIIALTTEYPEVDQIFAEVAHLIKPPYLLLQPRIIYRVITQLLRMDSANN